MSYVSHLCVLIKFIKAQRHFQFINQCSIGIGQMQVLYERIRNIFFFMKLPMWLIISVIGIFAKIENERNGKESVSNTMVNRTYSREHLLMLYVNMKYYASNQLRRSYSANYKFGEFIGLIFFKANKRWWSTNIKLSPRWKICLTPQFSF